MTASNDSATGNDVDSDRDDKEKVEDNPVMGDAPGKPAMEGGDRERGDIGGGADEAGRRSHELSQGEYGPTTDYGDG